MNKTYFLSKLSTVIIAIVPTFFCLEVVSAAPPEGHDFTKIPTGASYVPGELLVRFAPKSTGIQRSTVEKNQILTSLGGAILKHEYKLVSGLSLVKLPAGHTVEAALKVFNNTRGMLYAEPNYEIKLSSTFPDDTRFDDLWGMHNTGQSGGTEDADIDAPEAWDISTDAEDIIVAVIDTGIDYDHIDLAANMWVNPGEQVGDGNGDGKPGVAGVDDDGDGLVDEDSEDRQPGDPGYTNDLVNDDDENGYVDDIYGYDFCTYEGKQRDSDPDDDNGHGTHCAGTIGAVGNNDKGVAGVCWNVQIMALKFLSAENSGLTSDAIDSIEYAVEMGADVLSNSWGGTGYSQGLKDEIDEAGEAGILFVAGAGNYGSNNDSDLYYPASYDCNNIIAVMATDHDDERSIWFSPYSSNWGATSVDLGAPGSNIYSCLPNDQYGDKSGTSMAVPHVAGACALVWSRNRTLSHLEVKDVILDTVDVIDVLEDDPVYGRLCVTGGRLNLYNAVIEAGGLSLNVNDGIGPGDCVSPEDYIEYQISYSNPITDPNEWGYLGDANDVVIIDYLPSEGVDFISADPNTGEYDPNECTYTWNIGQLSPGEEGSLSLVMQVSRTAEPLSEIINQVEIKGDISHAWATEKTPVCLCGDYGQIIYVDETVAVPEPNGTSWQTAFDKLQDALTVALPCDEIWVAYGTYKPSEPNAFFQLGHSVRIYGGFRGGENGEEERYERNWFDDNETILNGQIGQDNADYVISIRDANAFSVLDGFTITGGGVAGIYCDDVSPIIQHNKITANTVGIYCDRTKQPVIKNNWIYRNSYGLQFDSPFDAGVVRNNTIVNNSEMGIYQEYGVEPAISNCIFTGNPEDSDLVGCYATYSYIEYPTVLDPNGTWPIGEGNIDGDPNYTLFEDGDNDNYLLNAGSSCIDAGGLSGNYTGERDMDKHFRVLDGDGIDGKRVDMGADEYCDEGTDNVADFNADDIVDTNDLVEMAAAWLIDSNDPEWESQYAKYNLNTDDVINYGDFAYFAQEWLWMTCEKMQGYEMMEMMMGMGGGMGRMGGGESQQSYREPTIEEQIIAQIKEALNRIEEEGVKTEADEDIWLWLLTSLEEWLKELEDSQEGD